MGRSLTCFAYSESRQEDLVLMLATQVYLRTQSRSKKKMQYTFARNKQGIYFINLSKFWEKLMIATKIFKKMIIKFTNWKSVNSTGKTTTLV